MKANETILRATAMLAAALAVSAAAAAVTVTIPSPDTVGNAAAVTALTNACKNAGSNYYTIELEPGVYDLSGVSMAYGTHLVVTATFYGVLRGKGTSPADTVLLGGGATDGCRVLNCSGKGAGFFTVENLTVTGGNVTGSGGGIQNGGSYVRCVGCVVSNNVATQFGGGADGVSFDRCLVTDNHTTSGGGAARLSGTCFAFNSTFTSNTADKGGAFYYVSLATNCYFAGNKALNGPGGAIRREHQTVLVDCTFVQNSASGSGGGVYVHETDDYLTNCTFIANTGSHGMAVWGGVTEGIKVLCHTGGVAIVARGIHRNGYFARNRMSATNQGVFQSRSGTMTFANCLFKGNVAGQNALNSIFDPCSNGSLYLYNCTVVDSELYSTANSVAASTTKAINTIFANTSPYDFKGANCPTMTNCLWTAHTGTVPAANAVDSRKVSNLRFEDAAAGDYTPALKSPARNAGWGDAAYLSALGPFDFAGNPRVFLKDDVGVIDIGCLESQAKSPALRILVR